jgi:hypothetical protein
LTTGVLLLHGSSGMPDLERARILEAEGYDVLAPQWSVGSEVPLESFPLDELAERNDRLVVIARIPVERIREVLLVAGGDDKVWPAVEFAEQIVASRGARETRVVTLPGAGHRVVLPGEQPKTAGQRMARGGSAEADRELGALAWDDVRRVLTG